MNRIMQEPGMGPCGTAQPDRRRRPSGREATATPADQVDEAAEVAGDGLRPVVP